MRTVEELVLLASETLALWLRALPHLLLWWGLGFAVHELAILSAAALGAEHRVLATVIFVIGMVAQLAALVLMIHSVRPHLQVPAALRDREVAATRGGLLPDFVATDRPRTAVLSATLGPFLAVYAVWGLTQAEVTRLVSTNLTLHGLRVGDWSVQLVDWRFYLVLALAAWVLRRLVGWIAARTRNLALAIGEQLLEGVWVLATFIAAVQVGRNLTGWLATRRVNQWRTDLWTGILDRLGAWFGTWVPTSLEYLVSWIWHTGLPALAMGIALPLMWLALTATVFGWQSTAHSLVRGTRWDANLQRVSARTQGAGWAPVRWVGNTASADWRDKWLPVLNSLRLIVAAGPRFVGSYLLLGAIVATLAAGWDWLLLVLGGPLSPDAALAYQPVRSLLAGIVFVPLQVALYAAAFDRGVADTSGVQWRSARIRRATQVGG